MLGDQHSFTSCWETDWRQTTKPTRRRRPSSLASSLRWWQTSGHTLHDIFASFLFFYFAHLMFLKQNLRLKYRYTISFNKKMRFFTFGQFTRVFGIGTQIRGTTMRKLRSWAFRKCRTFWVWESPKGSYCCSKSTDFENLGPLAKLRGVTKKSHGQNFDFSGLARNQRLTNRVGSTLIPCRARKIKIVAVTFFCDAS